MSKTTQQTPTEDEQKLIDSVCQKLVKSETRRTLEALRVLGDPRVAVHLPVQDEMPAAATLSE
jgi:hypothetical protein